MSPLEHCPPVAGEQVRFLHLCQGKDHPWTGTVLEQIKTDTSPGRSSVRRDVLGNGISLVRVKFDCSICGRGQLTDVPSKRIIQSLEDLAIQAVEQRRKLRLLDLFCGAGGAAVGYHRAGFDEIVGVDIAPQPNYPFEFIQADALSYCLEHGSKFDLIHASPPCQFHSCLKSVVSQQRRSQYQDFIPQTRQALQATGVSYVIENVYGARRSLINPIMLCGSQFDLRVYRHRLFETSFFLLMPPHAPHGDNLQGSGRGLSKKGFISVSGNGGDVSLGKNYFPTACKAMCIDWMSRRELSQAIPPAFTKYVGEMFIGQLDVSPLALDELCGGGTFREEDSPGEFESPDLPRLGQILCPSTPPRKLPSEDLQSPDPYWIPTSAWLERAKCHGRKNSYQVFWRSTQPIFDGKKRKYVGMAGSAKAKAAEAAIARRRELEKAARLEKNYANGQTPLSG